MKRRPKAHIIIVGGDGVSYGDPAPGGISYRQLLLKELKDSLDLNRLHFLGSIPYNDYLSILKISSVHVYLTYPFVLSWSLLEAMSCGCSIVTSATPPVLDVLQPGKDSLMADFFSSVDIADQVERVLDDRDLSNALGKNARKTIIDRFELSDTLIAWEHLLDDLVNGRKPSLHFNSNNTLPSEARHQD